MPLVLVSHRWSLVPVQLLIMKEWMADTCKPKNQHSWRHASSTYQGKPPESTETPTLMPISCMCPLEEGCQHVWIFQAYCWVPVVLPFVMRESWMGRAIRNEGQQAPLIGQIVSVIHVAMILLVAYDSHLHNQILCCLLASCHNVLDLIVSTLFPIVVRFGTSACCGHVQARQSCKCCLIVSLICAIQEPVDRASTLLCIRPHFGSPCGLKWRHAFQCCEVVH